MFLSLALGLRTIQAMPVSHAYFEGTLAPFERHSNLAETLTCAQTQVCSLLIFAEAHGRRWFSRFVALV